MRSAVALVVTVGVVGIVIPLGRPVVGKPLVGKPEVGLLTEVFEPISGRFLKSSSELTGVPTSTEMVPFLSSMVPAGTTNPLAYVHALLDNARNGNVANAADACELSRGNARNFFGKCLVVAAVS